MKYAVIFLVALVAVGCTQSVLFGCRKDPNYKYCPEVFKR